MQLPEAKAEESPEDRQKRWSRESYLRNKEKVLAKSKARYADPDLRAAKLAKGKEWHERNKADKNAKNLEAYYKNHESRRAKRKEWLDANRDVVRQKAREYAKMNPDVLNRNTRKRYARKTQATPAWANSFFIAEAYKLAKLREVVCGGKWHVDHIVPLRSKLVCGLHCEANIRVIRAEENWRKNNKTWPGMP